MLYNWQAIGKTMTMQQNALSREYFPNSPTIRLASILELIL